VSKPLEIERRIAELDSGAAKTVPWEEVRRRNSRSFHVAGKKIEFHDEAAAEYGASFDWYLGRSPDAARNFDSAVETRSRTSGKLLFAGHLVHSTRDATCCRGFRFLRMRGVLVEIIVKYRHISH